MTIGRGWGLLLLFIVVLGEGRTLAAFWAVKAVIDVLVLFWIGFCQILKIEKIGFWWKFYVNKPLQLQSLKPILIQPWWLGGRVVD